MNATRELGVGCTEGPFDQLVDLAGGEDEPGGVELRDLPASAEALDRKRGPGTRRECDVKLGPRLADEGLDEPGRGAPSPQFLHVVEHQCHVLLRSRLQRFYQQAGDAFCPRLVVPSRK